MAGYFSIGETKIRPGAYFNVASAGDENSFGAVDGIVAVVFRSNMGPLMEVNTIDVTEGYEQVYGDGGTTDALREAAFGGARTLVAIRIGSGGTAAAAELTAATGKLKVTAKSVGAAGYTVTVRNSLTDADKKEIIFFNGTTQLEKYEFAAGGDEVAAAIAATANSTRFLLTAESSGAGAVTNVSQSALTGGADPTVTNADYSNAFLELEKHYFNTICVDTNDASVHTLLAAFLERIYLTGSFGIGVVAQAHSVALATRETAAAAFNSEKMAFPLNAYVEAGDLELDGYQVAAYYAGLIASTPSNESITHKVLGRYTNLKELLTNSQIEAAEQSGCLVLSTSAAGISGLIMETRLLSARTRTMTAVGRRSAEPKPVMR